MYKFFEFQLDSARGLTRRGDPVPLEPQALQLLEFLVRRREGIVSKEDIIEEIWNGNAITDAALNTRIRSVRKALDDTATASRFIKTFPKRGFQFVAPVSTVEPLEQAKPKPSRRWAVAAFLAATGILSVWLLLSGDGPDGLDTNKPSIAVTRFDDLSEDASARYFADGLTDDLTTHLSRNRELFVVSSATVFSYVEETATPLEIARDLGVGYVVRGSIRRAGNKVRVSGELVEVIANETIWAEAFERELIDIFEVQDEISQAIAGRLLPEIYQADVSDVLGKPTDDLDAWDLYLRGRARQTVFSKEAQIDAIEFAEKAIARDPDFAAAYSLKARTLGTIFFFQWSDTPQETLVAATEAARRAISLDDRDAQAHAALGYIYRFTGDAEPAIANLERAVMLNPNDARIRLELAHTYDWFRMQEDALPQIDMALRLSPRDPMLQNMYFYKGHILFHLGRHEEALEAARQLGTVATSKTWQTFHHLLRAANLIELERAEEAKSAVEAALDLNPNLSITAMQRQFAGSKNHPKNRRLWLSSLRNAGIPN
ncbi:TolB amino-terminal domain-containing protein [Cribrihabitans marinus]|uniref:TolB amino-terminal domain-containing protein n=1 Tax=Cribrihabitans marinus TaxID=1227549 RepID=A0A1H6U0P5_9RHOB|nr:winged helix-turn-helix domain-containing protein [Cribrihabitans marinus]GGH21149.1 transcriptional regulator [Cribrihabitans marinus]SEI85056.1 TolB amino-terminal domain-containing protein [Cribrihabitans marinus]